jgi:hypothetical protein
VKSIAALAIWLVACTARAEWKVERVHDRMTDRDQVSFVLQSRERLPGAGARPARLVLRCQYPATDLILEAGSVLAPSSSHPGFHPMRIRLDKEAPEALLGRVGQDNTSLYFPEPRGLVPRLVTARALLIEVTPFQRDSSAVEFNVAGLAALMPEVERVCAMT